MVRHILPIGFQRICYYGLHSHPRYQSANEQLSSLQPSSQPSDPRGFLYAEVARLPTAPGKQPLISSPDPDLTQGRPPKAASLIRMILERIHRLITAPRH